MRPEVYNQQAPESGSEGSDPPVRRDEITIAYQPILRGAATAVLCYFLFDLVSRALFPGCLLYTSPSPRDLSTSRMPSSA